MTVQKIISHIQDIPSKGKRLALVVGVNVAPEYGKPALQYASNDAMALAQILEKYCGFELLEPPMLNEMATSDRVKDSVRGLARDRTDEDFLLMYFSGHGQPMEIEIDERDIYLVTSNFKERDVEEDNYSHLSMSWIRDKLYIPTAAGRVLLILDCCYAGEMGRTAPDPYLEGLRKRINYYFGAPGRDSGARSGGLRLSLAATRHNEKAGELKGHSLMMSLVLPVLRGEVKGVIEDQGEISIQGLHRYLERRMPTKQKPSLSGDTAGRDCILACYPEFANKLRDKGIHPIAVKRPRTYISYPLDPLFQERPGEFDRLATLLFDAGSKHRSVRLGLVPVTGKGGVGKTKLAVELCYRYQNRFPGGIFWMNATGDSIFEWQSHFAKLTKEIGYLPPDDDPASNENERRRAQHFCRYLADHRDALLVLDNVENPDLVISAIPDLVGKEPACTILYTSRNLSTPYGIIPYTVKELPEPVALRLLLPDRLSNLLPKIEAGGIDSETLAARTICQYVGYLPLALVHLRGLLERDNHMSLSRLAEVLPQRGTFYVIKDKAFFNAFRLSWGDVKDEHAQLLFKLACYFPEDIPIPLWLVGLAAGLGESRDIFDPLGEMYIQLRDVSLLEELTGNQVRLHPLVREFGLLLNAEDRDKDESLREEAGKRLVSELADLNRLEQRALRVGYWQCLEQVQAARDYAELLGVSHKERLAQVERWLDRESYLLGDTKWWPERIKGLFYQQLFNRSIEAGHLAPGGDLPERWLQQEYPVGAEDQSLERIFAGHTGPVLSVAFSPDGLQILTGSDDGTVRMWEIASGRELIQVGTYSNPVWSVAFSPDGSYILAGLADKTARMWSVKNGQELLRLEGHTSFVTSVTFDPDGLRILTGSMDGTAIIWDVESGKELKRLQGHKNWINEVCFSSDGRQVLSGSADETVRVWDVESERELQQLVGHTNSVSSIAISPNARWALSGSYDNTARVWDLESGRELLSLKGHNGPVSSVAFSKDGHQILTGSWDKTVRVWLTADWQEVVRLEGCRDIVRCVAFAPDGNSVLAGSDDGTAKLWKMEDSK